MKLIKHFLVLVIAILGFSFVNVEAKTYDNDTKSAPTLERQVFKQLIKLPYYGVFDHIAFQIDGSTVTLYGKVANATNRKSAERVVKRIQGVDRVVNNIEILPLSSFDDSIRYRTLRTLANGGSLYRYLHEPNPSIRIIVENGRVTLEGFVNSKGDSNLANILANGVSGVFSVRNNLQIDREVRY
jgi:hyperosmotically inducible periplasmic protein